MINSRKNDDMPLKPLCKKCACRGEVEFQCFGCGKDVKKKNSKLDVFDSDVKGININHSGSGSIVINAESIACSGLGNSLREEILEMMDLFRKRITSKSAELKVRRVKRSICGRKFSKYTHTHEKRKKRSKNRTKPKSEGVDNGGDESIYFKETTENECVSVSNEGDCYADVGKKDELSVILRQLNLHDLHDDIYNSLSALLTPQVNTLERQTIWQGVLEWNDKQVKNPSEAIKHVPCSVTFNAKAGEPEIKVGNWPQKLVVQLLPKQLISSVGSMFLKNAVSLLFHPTPCDALDSLTKVMGAGYAGCIQFNNVSNPSCDIKVLILLYTAEKNVYLGFIPNDQMQFFDRLCKFIQQTKNNSALRQMQSGQMMNPAAQSSAQMGNVPLQSAPTGNEMMPISNMNNPQAQQKYQMGAMLRNEGPMQTMGNQSMPLQNPNIPRPMGLRGDTSMMARPPVNDQSSEVMAARQQNLAKIQHLRQTLAAAHRQELQFQNQLEYQPTGARNQMVNPQNMPQQQSQPVMNMHSNMPQMTSQSKNQFDGGFDFLN